MPEMIECNQVELAYESYRMHNAAVEQRLFISLERHGIHTPLVGISSAKDSSRFILLDGYKRFRCAQRLGIEELPMRIIGTDIVTGSITMLRSHDLSGLNSLEQASFIFVNAV